MRRPLALAACFALLGCGGAPFTEASDLASASSDAPAADAPEGGDERAPGLSEDGGHVAAEAGGPHEASTGPEASLAEAGAPGDARTTCTPLSVATRTCPAPLDVGVPIPTPDGFAYAMWNPVGTDGGGYAGCSVATTPIACQCEETFDCGCLLAHVDGPALCQKPGAAPTCEVLSGMPVVICPGA